MGIGILKAIFGQSEKYPSGSRMSITPVSGLKMRAAGCEKGLPDPCAQDIPNHCDTVGGLRCVAADKATSQQVQVLPCQLPEVRHVAIPQLLRVISASLRGVNGPAAPWV